MTLRGLILGLMVTLNSGASLAVTFEWVTVGNPLNPPDTEVMDQDGTTDYGSVPYSFRIAKYEVTNTQYAAFLNAVARSDPNNLWSSGMAADPFGGITRSGVSGSYTYATIAGRENWPVGSIGFPRALRFVNWLHNGQRVGEQTSATTESGAYTITTAGISGNTIERNAGARYFLPSEDEWYKSAYYDPATNSYFDFPTGTDSVVNCVPPGPDPNTARCAVLLPQVEVGSYPASSSPYGTFDQAGNVWEWTEGIHSPSAATPYRALRGGSSNALSYESAAYRRNRRDSRLSNAHGLVGFRVASPIPRSDCDGCGLGPELALLLPPLWWLRRRAR